MFRMKSRKGITPVIAIVLLLMVTVGAVGVVYTQFQSIIGDPGAATEDQQQVRQTEMSFSSVYKNSSDDDLAIEFRNTGDVSWNTSDFTMQFVPGGDGTAVGIDVASGADGFTADSNELDCFSAASSPDVIEPSESYSCNTGFDFPSATTTLGIQVEMNGADKSWDYSCTPSTSDSLGC